MGEGRKGWKMGRGRSVSETHNGWEGRPNKTETGRKLYSVSTQFLRSLVFTHSELNVSNPPLVKKKDNLYK